MRQPLVSVVIPSYNQARFLREALESVLAQTYVPLEIIVVDDGSTDDSVEVASSFGQRIKLIKQENAGPAAARNTGILASKGEMFCLLDSDDVLAPNCISKRAEPFLSDPNVGMVAGACRFVNEQRQPLAESLQPRGKPNPRKPGIYIREWWSPMPGLMISRRALEVCGLFDTLLLGCEDFDLQMRVTRRFKHVYLEEVLADYRVLPASRSRTFHRHFEGLLQALTKNRAYAASQLIYQWHATVALVTHTADGIYGRLRKEQGLSAAFREMTRLARRWPVAAPIFLIWLVRSAWHRALGLAKPKTRSAIPEAQL